MPKRLLLVWISLLAAALACARSEVPITPATPAIATPVQGGGPARPTETAPAAGYPAAASPTRTAPTETSAPGGYPANPTPEASPTPEPPTPTNVIQLPPTETPTLTPTREPTATAAPATTQAPAANTPAATVAAPTRPPSSGLQPIPANAQFVQSFEISSQGGQVVGLPNDMKDGRPETWASLRGGSAAWVFNLGNSRTVLGLRVNAQPDFREPTTLTKIEVSADGTTWRTVLTGSGECGVPSCDTLPQKVFTDLGFGAWPAQYVRVTGGPTRFAFGEVQIAVAP